MRARPGDDRPLRRRKGSALQWIPSRPFRWLPRHGDPFCVCEWVTQHTVKGLARLPVYTAVVVTAVLLVQVFGVPWSG